MPLPHYGVLVGKVIDKMDSPAAMQKNPGSKPHLQILVEANNVKHAQLSNEGSIIPLLNKDGLKIDGVSYTKKEAGKQGHLVVF